MGNQGHFPAAGLALAAALLLVQPVPAIAGGKAKAKTKVATAIDSVRGHDPRENSTRQAEALDKRLDKAWDVLEKYADVARPAIREALAAEQDDSFFIIDLSHVLLGLDPTEATMAEISTYLIRADPEVYPGGYFEVASALGGQRCTPCLAAVLKLMELGELNAFIAEHAMPVNLPGGLTFSVGPYGDAALEELIDRLGAEDCNVRGNAAFMIGQLLPETTPETLRRLAVEDPCPNARHEAWRALGMLGDPSLADLIDRRLTSESVPDQLERLVIVASLGEVYFPWVYAPLERLATDADAAVAEAASNILQSLRRQEDDTLKILENVGTADAETRSRVAQLLTDAAQSHYFEFEGSALQLEAAVTVADLRSLNAARAAVLARRSDECLSEFRKLRLAATVVRQIAANASP